MTEIDIPPAALEAAARAICAGNKWDAPCAEPCTDCVPEARAALFAGLKAWPGAYGNGPRKQWKHYTPAIILPLPQEGE